MKQKNHATSWDQQKSCNLSGQKNHAFSWDKKSCNLSGQKKHTTSQDKKMHYFGTTKIVQFLVTKSQVSPWNKKKACHLLGPNKILQPLWTKKITQPLGTKKSHNLFGQKNHVTSFVNCSLIMRNTVASVCYNHMLYSFYRSIHYYRFLV